MRGRKYFTQAGLGHKLESLTSASFVLFCFNCQKVCALTREKERKTEREREGEITPSGAWLPCSSFSSISSSCQDFGHLGTCTPRVLQAARAGMQTAWSAM